MAGVVEQAHIGAVQLLGESPDPLFHVALAEVDPLDHVEAELAQLGGNVGGVVARIAQRRGVLVCGVADDERHALLGGRRRERGEERRKSEETGGEVLEHGGLHELERRDGRKSCHRSMRRPLNGD